MAVRTAIDRSNGKRPVERRMTGRTVDRPVRNPDRYRTGPGRNGRSPVPVPSMVTTIGVTTYTSITICLRVEEFECIWWNCTWRHHYSSGGYELRSGVY